MSISTVTSESLQLKLRQLLPSQQGFGTDLSASDTIIPIIDLTGAAEGSDVPENLQTALAFGSQTEFSANNSTDVAANTAGFYRMVGTSSIRSDSGKQNSTEISLSDGATTKAVWKHQVAQTGGDFSYNQPFDLIIFLDTSETISVITNDSLALIDGSIRQIATSNGTLVQPSGFTPQ